MSGSVLVCDKDKDFVTALTAHLMSVKNHNRGFMVTGYSEEESLCDLSGDFDTLLVSEDFQEIIHNNPKIRVKTRFILKETNRDIGEGEYFKYQNIDGLTALLCPGIGTDFSGGMTDSPLIGIYSPSRHELSLPYALCLCKELANEGETLFIDLSEIGILPFIVGDSPGEDLIDLVFMLENHGLEENIGRYVTEYEGIFILSPGCNPSQFSYITPAQWKTLFLKIKESGFKNIVVLFGNLIQGFSDLAGELKSLMIIKKPGEYFSLAEEAFMDFMEKLGLRDLCKEINLPLSISGGLTGSFRMGGLINGKLREYVSAEGIHG